MGTLTRQTIKELLNLDMVLSWNDLTDKERSDIETVARTIWNREKTKTKRRTANQVIDHTLQGYICEYALDRAITNIIDNAKVTENAVGLSYKDIKTDKLIDGVKCEIKSWEQKYYDEPLYGEYCLPIADGQYKSIEQAIPLNKYIICMSWNRLKEGCYRVKPQLIIDTKIIRNLYKRINWTYSKIAIDIPTATKYNTRINDFNVMESL